MRKRKLLWLLAIPIVVLVILLFPLLWLILPWLLKIPGVAAPVKYLLERSVKGCYRF